MYVKKKMLLLVVEIYIFGISPAVISATSQKIIARIIQSIGELLFPIAFGVMRDKFEPEKIAVALGIFVSMFSVGCSNRSRP